ncbi:MAG: Nif3-like dinuclear metal center hexameric protein [Haloferacaceae archaeon]
MELSEFARRLDEELRTDAYADLDASANGVQVGRGDATVERAAFAVDAAVATAEAAADAGADVLVTHHGLVWGGIDRVTGRAYDRLAPLFADGIGLYVSHLPLDGHPELGNAARLADLLDLRDRAPFGALGGEHVGVRGTADDPYDLADLTTLLDRDLDTGASGVRVLDFGPDRVRDVAVLTGSGADWLDEAAAAGVDAFVTGEGKGKLYHEAREAGLNVLLAGHYATETFGVRALADLVADWGVETTFLDHPTGL